MPNTKMTAEKFKIHFYYHKVLYAVVIVASLMLGSLLFTTTTYVAPNEHRIDIELIGGYMSNSSPAAEAAIADLLTAGQAWETERDAGLGIDTAAADYKPDLEELTVVGLSYTGDGSSENDYYAAQKFMVMLAAQEGDIYVLNRQLMLQLLDSNLLVPLDKYIADGLIDPGERNLGRVTFEAVDDDGNPTGEEHIFALQADYLTGLYDTFEFDPTDMYVCIVGFSRNQDTAAAVLAEMQTLFETGEPLYPVDETAEDDDDERGAFYQPDDAADAAPEADGATAGADETAPEADGATTGADETAPEASEAQS